MTNKVWVRLHPDQEKYWGGAAVVKFENAEFTAEAEGGDTHLWITEPGKGGRNLAMFPHHTYIGVTTVETVAKMWMPLPENIVDTLSNAFVIAHRQSGRVADGIRAVIVEHLKMIAVSAPSAPTLGKGVDYAPGAVAQHLDPANSGHGHVRPRPDGVRARCGGPAICAVCQREQAREDDRVRKMQGYEPLAEGEIVEAKQRELERNERLATVHADREDEDEGVDV